LKSPIIADCAVVGVYDSAQVTELPRAYITLKSDLQLSGKLAEKIMKYITDEILRFKHMRSVYVINDMPKRLADKALHRIFGD
jgi:acyl-coenzyme A synthetase/AMP-(fatty) acid ligase